MHRKAEQQHGVRGRELEQSLGLGRTRAAVTNMAHAAHGQTETHRPAQGAGQGAAVTATVMLLPAGWEQLEGMRSLPNNMVLEDRRPL